MKVLIYYPENLDQVSGSRNRILNVAEELGKKHEVYLAATSIFEDRIKNFTFIKIPHLKFISKITRFINVFNVLKIVKKIKPDIIYSFLEISFPTIIIPAKVYKIPHVTELQDPIVEDLCYKFRLYKRNGLMYKLLNKIVKALIRKIDFQIIGCKELWEYYKDSLGKGCIMPPGISMELFNDKIKPHKIMEKIKKERKNLLVMYAGNFNKYQGVDFLFETAKELKNRNIKDFTFVLIGNMPDAYKQKIEKLGIASEVVPLGRIPNEKVGSYLRGADILVIPRIDTKRGRYAFPSKILEYMAVGKCVLSTKGWPGAELIKPLETGMIIKETKEDFIEKLAKAKEEKLRKKLGTNAAKIIREKYDVKKDVIKISKIFEEVIAEKKK